MVDRRLVEIPEPLADESFDAYIERLAVLSDYSLGVPPPIIVPGGASASGPYPYTIELKVRKVVGGLAATQCWINRLRFNTSGLPADQLVDAPTPPGTGVPLSPMTRNVVWALDGYLANENPSSAWRDAALGDTPFEIRTEVARGLAWPLSIFFMSRVPWPAFSSFGMQARSVTANYTPADFDLVVDGVTRLAVTGETWAALQWRWYAV